MEGLRGHLNLTPAEAAALDRLLDAWLLTEEEWEIKPFIERIRKKLEELPKDHKVFLENLEELRENVV